MCVCVYVFMYIYSQLMKVSPAGEPSCAVQATCEHERTNDVSNTTYACMHICIDVEQITSCVCVCVCMYAYMYLRRTYHVSNTTYACMHICTYVEHITSRVCVCMYAYVYLCRTKHVSNTTYACKLTHINTHMYTRLKIIILYCHSHNN